MHSLPPPSTLPPGSIVDSYRRDSGGMRQGQSTDQQLTEIEAFCRQHNLVHRHRFVDEARSGGSFQTSKAVFERRTPEKTDCKLCPLFNDLCLYLLRGSLFKFISSKQNLRFKKHLCNSPAGRDMDRIPPIKDCRCSARRS